MTALSTLWRRIRRSLGLTTQHGVIYGAGKRTRGGFRTRREARAWAAENAPPVPEPVVYDYEPVELWLPAAAAGRKAHVTLDNGS